jgi:tRNA(Ile)-lysidine synthase
MPFNANLLLRTLTDLQGVATPRRYLVGFSGGLDSTVLVHALKQAPGPVAPIVAVHINHALQPDAGVWEEHCRSAAEALGVEFVARTVVVTEDEGVGLEAAAREVRYAAFKELMQEGDVLLTAHHADDQAETLLLNLMRGSGVAGLAGIGASHPFGPGLLIRPMLNVSRQDIERYARECELEWTDDPSNLDLRFDRNYLRAEILPRLRQRWPAVAARLGHSAGLAAEAARLQEELAWLDLCGLAETGETDAAAPDRLSVIGLTKLSSARQRNVLRCAIKASGLPQAPAKRLREIQVQMLTAREDAAPLVRWPGAEVRRYRTKLYLLRAPHPQQLPDTATLPLLYGDGREVQLGPLGALCLERTAHTVAEPGIDPALVTDGLALRFRNGGEKIKPYGHKETRPLKKLLQEQAVVPWMRPNLPLLYAGDTLVAVADLWIAADSARDDGFKVRWIGKPSLF